MSWSQKKCLSLIDEYEKKELLWNRDHKDYFNKTKKHDAWVEIASAFSVTHEEAKKKMDSLLSSFRREKAKGRRNPARKNQYFSRWYAFKRMDFLLDRDKTFLTCNSANESELDSRPIVCIVDNEDNHTEIDIEGEIRPIESETEFDVSSRIPTPVSHTKKVIKKMATNERDPSIGEALGMLKTALNQQKESGNDDSDCFIFGQHVANKLRTYDSRIRNIMQYHINTLLYHADMGNADIEILPINRRMHT